MTRYAYIAALCGAAVLGACGDKIDRTVTGPAPAARMKFFNFAVGSPGVDFFANDKKVTAVSSTTAGKESTQGTAYPTTATGGAAAGGAYVGVPVGPATLTGRLTDTTTANNKGTIISTVTQTIEAGKSYTFYQSGIYDATTKKADAFVIEDNYAPTTDFTTVRVRFVNAISNGTGPMALYAKSQAAGSSEVLVADNIAYKGASAFTSLPGGIYDLYLRYTGSATNLATLTSQTLGGGRVTTITARGNVTSTATASRPTLDNTANF